VRERWVDELLPQCLQEERARRKKLLEKAERMVAAGEIPKQRGGKSDDDGPERTVESADAMMALLLAEEAEDKRKGKGKGKGKGDKKKKGKK
jgi:hypothetical protein